MRFKAALSMILKGLIDELCLKGAFIVGGKFGERFFFVRECARGWMEWKKSDSLIMEIKRKRD